MGKWKLSKEQQRWMFCKTIKVGKFYMFPRFGFQIYSLDGGESGFVDNNPFTKSLDHQLFLVKEIKDDMVVGNFLERPFKQDFCLKKWDLEYRGIVGIGLMYIFVAPFLCAANWWRSA